MRHAVGTGVGASICRHSVFFGQMIVARTFDAARADPEVLPGRDCVASSGSHPSYTKADREYSRGCSKAPFWGGGSREGVEGGSVLGASK